MIKKLFILLFLVTLGSISGEAQLMPRWYRNGTITTNEYVDTLKANLEEEQNHRIDTTDTNIMIMVYKIRDAEGNLNVTDEMIYEALDTLNYYFKEISMQFHIGQIVMVNDYTYGIVSPDSINDELYILHSAANMINLYLINEMEDYYGFTYYPIDTLNNYIYLRQDHVEGSFLISLMGSFFGLLQTHDQTGGIEFANEENCEESGDLLCDTYADPDLFFKVDFMTCAYLGQDQDPNGEFYVPSVANFMSNSYETCRCVFTPRQYKRMHYYNKKYRNYLR